MILRALVRQRIFRPGQEPFNVAAMRDENEHGIRSQKTSDQKGILLLCSGQKKTRERHDQRTHNGTQRHLARDEYDNQPECCQNAEERQVDESGRTPAISWPGDLPHHCTYRSVYSGSKLYFAFA